MKTTLSTPGSPNSYSAHFFRPNTIQTLCIGLAIIASMLLTACKDDEGEPVPETNTSFAASAPAQITFTGVTLNGTLTVGAQEALDCGFAWGRTPAPAIGNSNVKLFGPKESSQSLSFKVEDLFPNTKYYVRTVLMLPSGPVYGTETSFTTLRHAEFQTLEVTDITYAHVTINGRLEMYDDVVLESGFVWDTEQFPTIETSDKVYLGAQQSNKTVGYNIKSFEHKNTVYNYRTFIITPSGIIYGDGLGFGSLPELSWQDPVEFPGLERMGAVSFSIGTYFYMGLGHTRDINDNIVFLDDFWRFDQITNIWDQKSDFPGGGRSGAIAFSANKKGYVGTGASAIGGTEDFWEFDPSTENWTRKADFLGGPVGWAVGFSIGKKGYVGTGSEKANGKFLKRFYEYDPSNNVWTRRADFPGLPVDQAVGFSIQDTGYIGLGLLDESWSGNATQLWAYSPTDNVWSQRADCPTDKSMYGSVAFIIDDKAYVGLGWGGEKTAWEYDPETNDWTTRGQLSAVDRIGAVAFTVGDKAIIGTGATASTFLKDFVQFKPD